MANLGYETLLTILIPGATVFTSFWILLLHNFPKSKLIAHLNYITSKEWLFGVFLLVSSAFLGQVIASFMGLVEEFILDRCRRKKMGIGKVQYEREWYRYVDSLDEGSRNSWISRCVLTFYFESRMAFALLIFSTSILFHIKSNWGGILFITLSGLGALGFWKSIRTHAELAKIRRRKFSGVRPI